ncbi:MAG TPA: metallophosphoesterase, partial [Anaerolineales bacterium]|nr:metallophosphoesterase [Anaerolineales bacterium]
MFFAYKSFGVRILVAITTLAGTFNLIPTQSTAEAVTQSGETARFAVIGDYGKAGQEELDVANLVKSWNPDFIVTTGDNNYMLGEASTIDENIGQYYHEFIHPYTGSYGAGATTNRFFPSIGNHDWDTSNAQPYLNYFTLPGNERYYDFVWGPVHFFFLDSDVREPDGNTSTSVQASWLQTKLARSTSAWQVVVLHHPPFSSGSTHGSSSILQWPYAAWGVDVVLAGHDHLYERLFRDGIPYFVTGSSGYPILYPFGAPITGSLVRYNSSHGALLVEATSSEMNFAFITKTGSLIDNY